MYGSAPSTPTHDRCWELMEKHQLTQLYSIPTTLRTLRAHDDDSTSETVIRFEIRFARTPLRKRRFPNLRVIATSGDTVDAETSSWLHTSVGKKHATVLDVWWQTEAGAHMISALPNITPWKPGSCGTPLLGIDACVLDANGQEILESDQEIEGALAIKQPWPAMANTILGNHTRYVEEYLQRYPGYFYTGDGCKRDTDGYFWMTGRQDGVIKHLSYRLTPAEIEAALLTHEYVAAVAVVGVPHPRIGESICAFVVRNMSYYHHVDDLLTELQQAVRTEIGAFASIDHVQAVSALPKTHSGEVMRSVLCKMAMGEKENFGDLSELADQSIIAKLLKQIKPVGFFTKGAKRVEGMAPPLSYVKRQRLEKNVRDAEKAHFGQE